MPVGMVCLLGECHELGSEGTEWLEIIAGVRLVAQTERGGSAVRAQSAAAARSGMDGKKIAGAGGAPAII